MSSIVSSMSEATSISANAASNVNFGPGKTITLLDQSLTCGKVKEALKITIVPSLKSQVDVAFAVRVFTSFIDNIS